MKTEIRLGEMVISNDAEQPCGYLVSVVTCVESDAMHTLYLCDDKKLKPYRNGCVSRRDGVTAIADFGVELRTDGDVYWCERIGESMATYRDGLLRPWQERGSNPQRHKFLASVMKKAETCST